MNGLDLFSGIGGISQALAPWVRTVAYCEREPYAQAVLLSRIERGEIDCAPIWDDVTTLRGDMLPRIDIITGGFPCQDLSLAGNRAGLAGERSGLFFQIVRLVRELQPSFVFMENVPGIFAGDAIGTVNGEMAALGYDCRWGVLSAYDVGAPHKRERWFCLANASSSAGDKRSELGSNGRQNKAKQAGLGRANSIWHNDGGLPSTKPKVFNRQQNEDPNRNSEREFCGWGAEPDVGRVANGLPYQRHRLKALGNGVVPQQVQEAFQRLVGLKST